MTRVLVVDDAFSQLTPEDKTSEQRCLEKLKRCIEQSGAQMDLPTSKTEALRTTRPDLLVLDIHLNQWEAGYTGFAFWRERRSTLAETPVLVLSAEPPGVNFFSQKKIKAVWHGKDTFINLPDAFLANQIRSLSTDIDNQRLDVVLDASTAQLRIQEEGGFVGSVQLQDPGVAPATEFRSSMSYGEVAFHLLRRLTTVGPVESSLIKPAFHSDVSPPTPQKFLQKFNDDIRDATRGRVGYKLIVNEHRQLILRAKKNGRSGLAGQLASSTPASISAPPAGDMLDRLIALERRVAKLERGGRGVGRRRAR